MKTAKWLFRIGARLSAAPLFVVLLLVTPTYAQVTELAPGAMPGAKPGTIYGAIHPPFGDPFDGGTITLTNESTGEKLTAKTNATGDFEFSNLPDGTFTVHVQSEGFAPIFKEGVPPGEGPIDFQMRGLMLWEPLAPVFSWAFHSYVGRGIRGDWDAQLETDHPKLFSWLKWFSTWAFAYLEVFHLLGLTVLLGSVVALGLRLSNLAMRSLPPAEVAREIRPYMIGGLALALVSGLLMFAAEAQKLFLSVPFEWKMTFFALANIFQFTAVSWIARSRDGSSLALGKAAALLSVLFWYVVAWEGRAIAFF